MKFIDRIIFYAMTVTIGGVAGCASAPKSSPVAFTEQALVATDSAKTNALEKDSAAKKAAIQRFETFNGDYSAANITNNLKNVYAAGVYFRDPFKEIHGEPELEAYLLRTSKAVAEFSMDWRDVAEHDGDYYFRWIMSLKLKRDGKNEPPNLTTGISHVRFGPDGRVIFHQDYFDAGAFLYEKIPVLGSEIRFIKKRI
jgi:hypothetical protein